MDKINLGAVTAYAEAVNHGYEGTKEEFGENIANFAKAAEEVAKHAQEVSSDKEAVESAKESIHEDLVSFERVAESVTTNAEAAESARSETEQRASDFDRHVTEQINHAAVEIGTAKNSAINAVTDQKNKSIQAVKDEAEQFISQKESDALASIQAKTEESVASVNQAGEAQKNAMDEAVAVIQDKVEMIERSADGIVQTASGTSVHVNDSSGKKIVGLEIEGKSEQKQYSGKNLFDKSKATCDKALVWDSGILFEESNSLVSDFLEIQKNHIYKSKYYMQVIIYDENKSYIGKYESSNSPVTRFNITDESCKYARIGFRTTDNSGKKMNSEEIMVVIDNNDLTPYEPYVGGKPSPSPEYPQEIVSVGDGGSVDIKIIGNNLIKSARYITNYENYSTLLNNVELSCLKENTTYTASICLVADHKTKAYWNDSNGNSPLPYKEFDVFAGTMRYYITFTTTKKWDGLLTNAFLSKANISDNVEIIPYDFQITLGEKEYNYEPYKEQIVSIPLTEPPRGIGDIKDVIRVYMDGSGEIVRKINRIVLTGDEDITDSDNPGAQTHCLNIPLTKKYNGNAQIDTNLILSDRYKFCEWKNLPWRKNNSISYQGNYNIRIKDEVNGATCTEYKEYLKTQYENGNPVHFEYYVSMPIIEPLTKEQVDEILALHTYKTTTNMYCDGADFKVEYVADTKTYVDKKDKEVQELKAELSEIKELLSASQTSAMLLDNYEKDLLDEV